jgi:Family of unknown function (DUF5819)
MSKPLKLSIYTIALIIICFHFILILTSILPKNALQTVTDLPFKYATWFWGQGWGFFAPEPVRSDTDFYIQCLANDKKQEASSNYELTEGLPTKGYKSLLHTYIDDLAVEYSNSLAAVREIKDSCTEQNLLDTDYCNRETKFQQSISDDLKERAVTLASAFCSDLSLSTRANYDQASIKIVSRPVRHWSKRFDLDEAEAGLAASFSNFSLKFDRGVGTWNIH